MASRVLLMVERDGRVVCAARYRSTEVSRFVRNVAAIGPADEGYASKPLFAAAMADRWWLVEAESAEAARRVIRWWVERQRLEVSLANLLKEWPMLDADEKARLIDGGMKPRPVGRILASVGRSTSGGGK